jgi:hypothetical protein
MLGNQTREAQFNLTLDSRGVEEGAKRAATSFDLVNSSVGKLGASTETFSQTISTSANSIGNLNSSIVGLEGSALNTIRSLDGLESRYSTQVALSDELAVTNERLAGRLTGVNKAALPVVDVLDQFTSTTERILSKEKAFDKFTEGIQIFNTGGKLEKGLRFTSNFLKDISVQVSKLGTQGEQVAKVIDGITKSLDKGAALVGIVDKIEDIKDVVEGTGEAISNISGALSETAASAAPFAGVAGGILDNVTKLNLTALVLTRTTKGLTQTLAAGVWKAPLYGITTLIGAINPLISGFIELDRQAKEFYRGLETMSMVGVDTTLAQMAVSMGSFGENLLFNIDATKQFVSTAVSEFGRLEDSVKYLQTLSVGAAYATTDLTKSLQTLATDGLGNAISSAELGISVYNNLSAGIGAAKGQIQDALEVSEVAAKYAISTGGNLESIQQALIFTSQAYNLKASEAKETMALLDGVVQQGITNASELSANIGSVAAVAASTSISLKDLLGAVAISTKTLGADAYIAMQRLIESFSSMAPQSKAKLAEFGVVINEQTLKTDGLYKTMQKLKNATQGNTEALREIIPESIAFRGALSLMNTSVEDADAVFTGLADNASGRIEEMFDRSQQSIKQRSQAISNGFAEVFASAGEKIMNSGLFDKGLDAVEKLLDYFQNMPEWVQKVIGGFIVFNYGLETTKGVVGEILKLAGLLVGVLVAFRFTDIINGFRLAFGAEQVKNLSTIQRILFGVNGALRGMFGLSTDYTQATSKLGDFTQTFKDVLGGTKDVLNKYSGGLLFAADSTDALTNTNKRSAFMSLITADNWKDLSKASREMGRNFLESAKKGEFFKGVFKALGMGAKGLGGIFLAVGKVAAGFFSILMSPISIVGGLVAILVGIGLALRDLIPGLGGATDKSRKLAQSFIDLNDSSYAAKAAIDSFGKSLDDTEKSTKKFDGFINNWVLRPLNALANFFGDFIPNIEGFLKRMFGFGQDLGANLAEFFNVGGAAGRENAAKMKESLDKSIKDTEDWKEASTNLINDYFTNLKESVQSSIDSSLLDQYESQLTALNKISQETLSLNKQIKEGGSIVDDAYQRQLQKLKDMEDEALKRMKKLGNNRTDELERKRIEGSLDEQRKKVQELKVLDKEVTEISGQQTSLTQKQVETRINANKLAAQSFIEDNKIVIKELKNQVKAYREAGKLELADATQLQVDIKEKENAAIEKNNEETNARIQKLYSFRTQIQGASKDIRESLRDAIGSAEVKGTIESVLAQADTAAKGADKVQASLANTQKSTAESAKTLMESVTSMGDKYRDAGGNLNELQTRSINSTIGTVNELIQTLNSENVDPDAIRNAIDSLIQKGGEISEMFGDSTLSKEILKFLDTSDFEFKDESGKAVKESLLKLLAPEQLQEVLEIKKELVQEDLANTVKPYDRLNEILDSQLRTGQASAKDVLEQQKKNNTERRKAEIKAQEEYLALIETQNGKNSASYKEAYQTYQKLLRDHKEQMLNEEKSLIEARFVQQEEGLAKLEQANRRSQLDGTALPEFKQAQSLESKRLELQRNSLQEQLKLYKEGSKNREEVAKQLADVEFQIAEKAIKDRQELRQREGEQETALITKNQTDQELLFARNGISREAYEQQSYQTTQKMVLLRQKITQEELKGLDKNSLEYIQKLNELSQIQLEFQKNVTGEAVRQLNDSLEKAKNNTAEAVQDLERQLSNQQLNQDSLQAELDIRKSNLDLTKAQADYERNVLENQLKRTGDIIEKARINYQITERQVKLQTEEFDLEMDSQKLQLETNKANLEREKIQIRINRLKLDEQEATLRTQLSIARLNNESQESLRTLELQLENLDLQRDQLNNQNTLLDKRIDQEEKVFKAQSALVEKRRELSKANGILDLELAKEQLITAQYEKQVAQADLRVKELETASSTQISQIERVSKSYEKQLSIIDKQKEVFSNITNTLTTQMGIVRDLTTSQNGQVRAQRKENQLRMEILTKQQAIDRDILEMQQRQVKMALQRELIESRIAEKRKEVELIRTETEARRILASREASEEEKKSALLAVQSSRDELALTREVGELTRQKVVDNERNQKIDVLNFARTQRTERLQAQAEIAKSTRGARDDSRVRNQALADQQQTLQEFNNFQMSEIPKKRDLENAIAKIQPIDYQALAQSLQGAIAPTTKATPPVAAAPIMSLTPQDLTAIRQLTPTPTQIGAIAPAAREKPQAVTIRIDSPINIEIQDKGQEEVALDLGRQMNTWANNLAIEIERRVKL